MRKGRFKFYRVYAKVMNLHGSDYYEAQGESTDEQGLYNIYARVREQFRDTLNDLDAYTYVAKVDSNGFEERVDIVPSALMVKYGGEGARELDSRIRRCQEECYYYIDPGTWQYCSCLGKKDCEKFVNIDVYLATHSGGRHD